MKIPILCLSLFALGLYICPLSSAAHQQALAKELNDNDINTFLETVATSQEDQDNDEDDEGNDLADIQGVFNVLAQVKDEQTKSTGTAMTQFWRRVGKRLLGAGKRYLKRMYCKRRSCNEEKEEKVLLQDLMEAQDDDGEEGGDDDNLAEVQFLFGALKKLQAKKMQENHNSPAAQGFWIRRRLLKFARKRLC